MNHIPALIIFIPLFSSYISYLFGLRKKIYSMYFATVVCFFNLLLSIILFIHVNAGELHYYFGGWLPPWGIEYRIDILNASFIVLFNFVGFFVSIYFIFLRGIDEARIPFFSTLYLLYLTGITGVTITGDIFNLYVFLEITALSSYGLVAAKGKNSLIAAINYLIAGTIGATFILIGIGYFYMATGTLNMEDLRLRISLNQGLFTTGFVFFITGTFIKMAVFPFYHWLPGVYSESLPAVAAFISATGTKLGCYILFRSFYLFEGNIPDSFIYILNILSIAAILFGGIMAVRETTIPRLFAYSSISHIGLITMGFSILNKYSFAGVMLHIVAHSLMKSTFFMFSGFLQKNGVLNIDELGYIKEPRLRWIFLINALSMVGIPLTAGFLSKWYILLGALKSGFYVNAVFVLVSAFFSAAYIYRLFSRVFFGRKITLEFNKIEFIPLYVFSIFILIFGISSIPIEVGIKIYERIF